MASSLRGATRFSIGLAARAAAVAVLAYAALQLAIGPRLYAVSAVLAGLATLALYSLRRAVTRADEVLARFVDGVAMGDLDKLGRSAAGFQRFAAAVDRASELLRSERVERQRRLEGLLTLVDSVPAALMVVEAGGRITLANLAARKLAGEDVARVRDIAALGPDWAERLLTLAPGGREMVRLTDGRLLLATALGFAAPGAEPQRLISLTDVAQLDAVELKAWQDLVRVLAHEMLNSLTPIVSLAESLQKGQHRKAEVADAIEVIARRSSGLMAFVDRYRKVAEIPHPSLRLIPLRPFLNELRRLMAPTFAESHVNFSSKIEPEDLRVEADPELLEQAMINLVKNAADAVAGVESPTVSIVCRKVEDQVEISVRDNGPGVAGHDLQKLFVPFFTTKAGGSGIGLSVARQIAIAHQGRLDAASAPPRGAVFTLRLPTGRQSVCA